MAVALLEPRLWSILLEERQLLGVDGTTAFPIGMQSNTKQLVRRPLG